MFEPVLNTAKPRQKRLVKQARVQVWINLPGGQVNRNMPSASFGILCGIEVPKMGDPIAHCLPQRGRNFCVPDDEIHNPEAFAHEKERTHSVRADAARMVTEIVQWF